METPHNKQNKWRATAIALAVLTVALAASLFATSAPADAKPAEYRVATQVDTDDDADRTSRLAAPDHKKRGFDAPLGWLCPAGTTAVAFDQPIYDDETGLWVVGYETVWYCLDLSGGPAG